jgi:hypothetical protein
VINASIDGGVLIIALLFVSSVAYVLMILAISLPKWQPATGSRSDILSAQWRADLTTLLESLDLLKLGVGQHPGD